jgi:hypothetical protein
VFYYHSFIRQSYYTRWFKYDRDYLCVNKSQFVPVMFEPPCVLKCGNKCDDEILYNGEATGEFVLVLSVICECHEFRFYIYKNKFFVVK